MNWKELTVIKEVRDNITNSVESMFTDLACDCTHQGAITDAQWRPCLHKDHEFHHHSYQMCRWDYCPRLIR